MEIDSYRIEKYLNEIASETSDIGSLLEKTDDEILRSPHLIKSLRYSIIVISEAMAGALQHILAKQYKAAVQGYTEVFIKSKEYGIVSTELAERLQPFFRFRNMLVHHYWRVDDRLFIENLRTGLDDLKKFVKEIAGVK